MSSSATGPVGAAVAPRHMDQIFANPSPVDEAEAIIARRRDRGRVRIIGLMAAALFGALHDLLEPAKPLGSGSAADRGSDGTKNGNARKQTRLHDQTPFSSNARSSGSQFSLRQLNES